MHTDEGRIVRDAEVTVREAGMEIVGEALDRGEIDESWPPGPDTAWDELRVRLTRYMERNVRDIWMLADVGFGSTVFDAAFMPALLFMGRWLKGGADEQLVDPEGDPAEAAALKRFLRLPESPGEVVDLT